MGIDNSFHTGRHVVHKLHAHLVFVPKYRKCTIDVQVFEILRGAWGKVCADFESELLESNFEPNHVHLMVRYPPKVALSTLVNSLKGVSARLVRAAHLPLVEKKLWGAHFWSPSYCAVSCGGAPLEIVARYVQSQCRTGSFST